MRSGKRSHSVVLPSMSVNRNIRSSIVTHVHYFHRQNPLKTLCAPTGAQFLELQPGRVAGRPWLGVKNAKPAMWLRVLLLKLKLRESKGASLWTIEMGGSTY